MTLITTCVQQLDVHVIRRQGASSYIPLLKMAFDCHFISSINGDNILQISPLKCSNPPSL